MAYHKQPKMMGHWGLFLEHVTIFHPFLSSAQSQGQMTCALRSGTEEEKENSKNHQLRAFDILPYSVERIFLFAFITLFL